MDLYFYFIQRREKTISSKSSAQILVKIQIVLTICKLQVFYWPQFSWHGIKRITSINSLA